MAKTAESKSESKSLQAFFYAAPDASIVQLVGDFTHWQTKPINMVRQPDGIWKASVALRPGIYHYRILVDGQWCDDPQCTLRIPNIFGSQNMVREVGDSADAVAQEETSGKGKASQPPAGKRA